jgi:nitrite reductase/ring-hydroxylating ferredoxin subunit
MKLLPQLRRPSGSAESQAEPPDARAPETVIDLGPAGRVLVGGLAEVRAWPGGPDILVVTTARGLFAVENRCPHLGLPLNGAAAHGSYIRCAFHGREYDMGSGACRRGKSGRLATYRCWVDHGHVFVAVPADRN